MKSVSSFTLLKTNFMSERRPSPENLGAKIIQFPVSEKAPAALDPEKKKEVLREIFEIDKLVAGKEEELNWLNGAIKSTAVEKRNKTKVSAIEGNKKERFWRKNKNKEIEEDIPPAENPNDPAYFKEALEQTMEEIDALLEDRNKLIIQLPPEDQKELETGLRDLRDVRKEKGYYLEDEKKLGKDNKKENVYPNWKHYENEEVILRFKGIFDKWGSHPEGVIIQKGDELLLNGKELLYKGAFDDWIPCPEGVIIQKGDELLLNGKELLYKGKSDRWGLHPEGVIIQKGDELLLNGKELLYKGAFDGWGSHPEGVIIRKGDEFLLNGKELLYKGKFDDWGSNRSEGVIIQKGAELLLNGKELLYKGGFSSWSSYPEGVIIRKGDEWIFYNQSKRKNGVETFPPEYIEALSEVFKGEKLDLTAMPKEEELTDEYFDKMYPVKQRAEDTTRGLTSYRPNWWNESSNKEITGPDKETWGQAFERSMRAEAEQFKESVIFTESIQKPKYKDGKQQYGTIEGTEPDKDPLLPIIQKVFGKKANRFNLTWDQITNELLPKVKEKIKDEFAGRCATIPDFEVILTPAIVSNLQTTLNHPENSQTNTSEWTSTILLKQDGTDSGYRLVAGFSEDGGAGFVYYVPRENRWNGRGFRLSVVFGK